MRRVKRTSFQLYFNRRVHFLMLLCPSSCIDELYVCLCVCFFLLICFEFIFFFWLFVCLLFPGLVYFQNKTTLLVQKKERKNMPLVIFIFKVVPKIESSEHRRCLTLEKNIKVQSSI